MKLLPIFIMLSVQPLLCNISSLNTELYPEIYDNAAYTIQQVVVNGRVTDAASGEPLPGATIIVQGTTTGTTTDIQGTYSIPVPGPSTILVITYVGYLSQEVVVGDNRVININLRVDARLLDEVIVVGYGTQLRSDLTGAVSRIEAERLLDRPAFNVAQAIGGRIPGVKITERTGAPGGNPFIRIRGTRSIMADNQPLVVVDGIVGVAHALTILNPNEIESVDVLKDASATAIYGARGSNGVILITTKRGSEGEVQVEYDSYVTHGVLQNNLQMLNSEQFLYVYTQAWMNINKYAARPNWPLLVDGSLLPQGQGGNTYSEMPHLFERTTQGGYTVPLIGRDGNYYKPRFQTGWEGETFKPSASTNHQLNVRGGTERARLGAFLGYSYEDGLLLNSYFNRYTGRVTGDFKINRWLDINSQIGVNKNRNRTNDVSFFSGGIARGVAEAYPIIPTKYPENESVYGAFAGQFGRNLHFPVGEVDHQSPYMVSHTVETFTDRSQFNGNITANFQITPGLTFRTNFAADDNTSKYNNYAGIIVTRGSQGQANINVQRTFYWQNENYFNYNKIFGEHSVAGLLGASWSRYTWENLNTFNQRFFDDFYGWHNIGVGTHPRPVPSSGDGQNSINSYFARLNYGYQGKYLLTLTGRVDGSSKFGADSKYGMFPSGSVAWRISQEDFAQNIEALSNLKIRFSAGQTGNQEIGSYVTQAFIGSTNVALGGVVRPGLFPSSMASPGLRWEKTTSYNAGIDLGLFMNRIMLTVDYYDNLTTDMLLNVPLPFSTTTGSVRDNYGKMENKGWEVMLTTHNLRKNRLNWYTNAAFTANRNKIVQLGPTGEDILRNNWVGGANTVLRVGEPVASFWGLNRMGTYGTQEVSLAARYGFVPGDVKYEDTNGDGRITVADGYLLGSPFPKWDMDLSNTVDFRNWDFGLDVRFSYGAKIAKRMNHSGEDRQTMGNSLVRVLDAWRPDHQNTMIGQVRPGMGGAYYQTYPDTHWIEDASFIRGEAATLGYTLPATTLGRIGVRRMRVYATARNFFVLTEYTGYDPEGSDSGNMDDITPHMDFYQYPRPTTYTFGVNVTF
jgi:TonB-dependent starch-binding outer membrane protein SusC